MIKTISAVLVSFFILVAAPLFGGESWHEKEFEVRQSPKVISDWLKDHPKEVARSTGSELISKEGNKVRVRQDTPKGMMEFTLQETIKDNGKVYDYKSKLIQVHEGLIEDQETIVKLSPSRRGGTIVTITLSASVRETKPIAIKTGLNKSARGFQEMVERKFN